MTKLDKALEIYLETLLRCVESAREAQEHSTLASHHANEAHEQTSECHLLLRYPTIKRGLANAAQGKMSRIDLNALQR